MGNAKKPLRNKLLVAGGVLLLLLVIIAGEFFWYVSDYYRAEDVAMEVLEQGTGISVQENLTILSPSYPTDTAVIFYPGAKVEAEAYLPLLDQIRQTGVTCILVHMPFHMAIFDSNAAEDVMAQFPDVQHWYMAGHSMGGAMASQFASNHPDDIDGLILLGAYIYGDYPEENTLLIIRKISWKLREGTTHSSATMAPRRGICLPLFPHKSNSGRPWLPLMHFSISKRTYIHKCKRAPSGQGQGVNAQLCVP